MNLLRWLARSAPPKSIPCPRCKTAGAEYRGPLVIPYDDGSHKKVGKLYGCPHCGAAWFTDDGAVRMFGHLKGTMNLHPQNWTPPPEMVRGGSVHRDEEKPVPDGDIRWR